MAVTIFPSANDVGIAEGDGRIPTEDTISALQNTSYPQTSRSRIGTEQFDPGGVISGFAVTGTAGLVATLAAGSAVIEGYNISDTTTRDTPTLTASTFNWVFLALTKSVGLVTGIELQVTTSTTYRAALASIPADAILLYMFETDPTVITAQLDFRGSPSNTISGSYIGDGAATRTITLGVRPKFVTLSKFTEPRLTCFSEMHEPLEPSVEDNKGFGLYFHERVGRDFLGGVLPGSLVGGMSDDRENRPQLEATGFSVEDGPATIAPGGVLMDRSTFDPPNIVVNTVQQTTVTVDGARVNDAAIANFQAAGINNVILTAEVTSADTVTVTFHNNHTAARDLASAELVVTVFTQPDSDYELNEVDSIYHFTAWF